LQTQASNCAQCKLKNEEISKKQQEIDNMGVKVSDLTNTVIKINQNLSDAL